MWNQPNFSDATSDATSEATLEALPVFAMTWINWMKFRQERFEGINYHPLDKMALHVWRQKSILKRGTFAVQLLPCDVAQPIRAQQSTLIMSDHAQLSLEKQKQQQQLYNDKNNKNNNPKTKGNNNTIK